MKLTVQFHSYFRDLSGCREAILELPHGARVNDLLDATFSRFPALEGARKCTLIAVGLDYQPHDHRLADGDVVSLFPPVQGG